MDTPRAMAHVSGRQPLPALSKWTIATLAAVVVMLIYLQVAVVGQFYPPLALVLGLPALIVAIPIAATNWRWAPLLAVLYWILLIASALRRGPFDITHPEYFDKFAFTVIVLALAVVGSVAGVSATVQNYRAPMAGETTDGRRRVAEWFSAVVWSLAGLCLGALLVGALPRAKDTSGMSPEALAALPVLRVGGPQFGGVVGGFQFDSSELRVKEGEIVALRLENQHDDLGHNFKIDEFNLHVSMPPGKPSLALFRAGTAGTYTFYCGLPGHSESGTLIVVP